MKSPLITLPPIYFDKTGAHKPEELDTCKAFFTDHLGSFSCLEQAVEAQLDPSYESKKKKKLYAPRYETVTAGYIIPYHPKTDHISKITFSHAYQVYKAVGGKADDAAFVEALCRVTGTKRHNRMIRKKFYRTDDSYTVAKRLAKRRESGVKKGLDMTNPLTREKIKERLNISSGETLKLKHLLGFYKNEPEQYITAMCREVQEETGCEVIQDDHHRIASFLQFGEYKETGREGNYLKDRLYTVGHLGHEMHPRKFSLSEEDQGIEIQKNVSLKKALEKQHTGLYKKLDPTSEGRETPKHRTIKTSTGIANYIALRVLDYLVQTGNIETIKK